MLLGGHRLSGEVAEPILVGLYSLPKITLYPVILLLFGLGMSAKVAFGALHGIIPVVLFTMNAVRNVNRTYLRAGRAMRLTPAQMGWHILIPATLPEIFTGLRIGFSLTLLGTMLGELFASQRGLGFLLMTAIDLNDVQTILSIAVLISIFAVGANSILLAIDRRLHRGVGGMTGIAVARDLGAPLHHQIYLVLADGIAKGRYGAGELLPTEEQLTKLFSVSRITVRRAMASLQSAGLIERGAGRRTMVKPLGRPLRMPMASVMSNIAAYGAETVAQVVEFGYGPAPAFLRERLWDAADKPVQRAVRIRSQDGVPVMHLTSYVPETLGSSFTEAELDRIPMFQLLARAGAHIAAGEQIVSATLAEPVVAQRLDVKVGAALIDLRSMMLDQHGRAVEYVEMLAVPERLSLRFELGADQLVPVRNQAKPRRRSS